MKFNETKAAQTTAFMLKLCGGTANYTKVIKLLYLADRLALLTWGRPISTDNYVSMEHGPVLSRVYNLMKTQKESEREWFKFICVNTNSNHIQLQNIDLKSTDCDELSKAELNLIRKIHSDYGSWDWQDIRDYMHDNFDEWNEEAKKLKTSIPIKIQEILEAEHKTTEEISITMAELQQQEFVEELLDCA